MKSYPSQCHSGHLLAYLFLPLIFHSPFHVTWADHIFVNLKYYSIKLELYNHIPLMHFCRYLFKFHVIYMKCWGLHEHSSVDVSLILWIPCWDLFRRICGLFIVHGVVLVFTLLSRVELHHSLLGASKYCFSLSSIGDTKCFFMNDLIWFPI